jgi:hypothetical protein
MHPPLILFDYRTREFEPTRRSFDFVEVTALSVRRTMPMYEFRYDL